MSPLQLPSDLPTDPKELQRLYVQTAQNFNAVVADYNKVKSELEWLKRQMFGKKSERLVPENQLALEGLGGTDSAQEVAPAAPESAPESSQPKVNLKKGAARQALPPELPREEVVHDLPPEQKCCACCGGEKCRIGEEVSEELDFIPARLFVRRHVRPKYVCRKCPEGGVAVADLPARPIDKGVAAAGLIAQVAVQKFEDHLPLNRQERIWSRHGLLVDQNRMGDWIKAVHPLVLRVVAAMEKEVLSGHFIHSDDTSVPVLQRGDKHKTHKGHIWVYAGASGQMVYRYTHSRSREGPLDFLKGYRGYLVADAYSGYDACYKCGAIIEACCWAHCRRGFFEAKDTDGVLANWMLDRIARLYEVEREAKDLSMGFEARQSLRVEKSLPVMREMKVWLWKFKELVLPQSPIGKAISYAMNQWNALCRFLFDGRLPIDNNAAERALRAVAIGRKNWMFAGSEEGAKRAAAMYSLIGSCKTLGLNSFDYLKDILERLPTQPDERIDDLTPLAWKMACESKATPA